MSDKFVFLSQFCVNFGHWSTPLKSFIGTISAYLYPSRSQKCLVFKSWSKRSIFNKSWPKYALEENLYMSSIWPGPLYYLYRKCMEIKILKNFLGREHFQWSGRDANQLFIFIWPYIPCNVWSGYVFGYAVDDETPLLATCWLSSLDLEVS